MGNVDPRLISFHALPHHLYRSGGAREFAFCVYSSATLTGVLLGIPLLVGIDFRVAVAAINYTKLGTAVNS
ncbi:hypothetical protein [Ensifer aridi]|uniref:hypothetical protein n=1 Tax=Ensifer aridi TaxID=1708715 RepID=UPI001124CE28|nr:hypothetical protein [Ensifer aridi]